MNKYEELMYKSELARETARKCETNWGWCYWNDVADRLYEKALLLNVNQQKKKKKYRRCETMAKTVLITGASKGIGAATAILFAQSGYNVVINYKLFYYYFE